MQRRAPQTRYTLRRNSASIRKGLIFGLVSKTNLLRKIQTVYDVIKMTLFGQIYDVINSRSKSF